MARQIRHQVGHDADRADAGAATAVRNAEGLVQIQVAHITTKLTGCGYADQGVHVGAIHIHPAAVRMHKGAKFFHLRFKHAVRAGVSDHHAGQVGAVLLALGFQVGHVDVALRVAGCHHHRHARHLRAGRVGAVGRRWNQTDVAVALAFVFMEGLDHQQAGVFTLRSGVGLQADPGIPGGLAQPVAQLLVQLGITLQLVLRCEGMDVGKLRPGDRNHLAGGVELHGATAQWNHAAVQRQVFVAEHADITQHAGFGVVGVEDRVGQEGCAAAQLFRNQWLHAFFKVAQARHRLARLDEEGPEHLQVIPRGGFIQRHAQVILQAISQVGPRLSCAVHYRISSVTCLDGDRIKGTAVGDFIAHLLHAARKNRGVARHALCDALEALGTVVDGKHAGQHGWQHLRGTNVGGGFFAANVLLAGLQRQPVGRVAMGVDADADQAAR